MSRNLLLACLLLSITTGRLEAQQPAQNPPAPNPQPAPPASQPRPSPVPSPSIPNNAPITITGRIITDTAHPPEQMIEVRFESEGGQRLGYTYTRGAGEFTYSDNTGQVGREQNLYVVVEVEGFKPYRERLNTFGFIGQITIFLERPNAIATPKSG